MPPRAKAAAKAKEPTIEENILSEATAAIQLDPPVKAPSTNGRKRGAKRAASPDRSSGPETSASVSRQSSELTEAGQESEPSQASSRKRARTTKLTSDTATPSQEKAAKPKTAPTRASKRTLTKASSKQLKVKETKVAKAKEEVVPKPPRHKKTPPPPVNPLPGIPKHYRPSTYLFVQGSGDFGQLGLGLDTLGPIKRPRLHAWIKDAVEKGELGGEDAGVESLAVGGMHNLMIDEAGRVWSWGINDGASLGRVTSGHKNPETGENIDSDVYESVPMQISDLVDAKFRTVFVAASDGIGLAISDKGELRIWGSFRSTEGILGFDGKPGSPKCQLSPILLSGLKNKTFVQAACGADHVVALTTEGRVYTWGDPRQSALGRKVLDRHVLNGLDPERLAIRDIVYVSSGNWHSFAIDADGVVYGWGLNSMGQLGIVTPKKGTEREDGDFEFEDHIKAPTIIHDLLPMNLGDDRRVTMISGGEHHTLFLLSDGSVYACGRCESGQLGLAEDHPAMVRLAEQKAADPETRDCIPVPTQVFFPSAPTENDKDPALGPYVAPIPGQGPITKIVHISAASRHNLAVSNIGVAYGWGYGNVHQLGMGDEEEQSVPARVKSAAIAGWFFTQAHAGGSHCLLMARKEGPVTEAQPPAAEIDMEANEGTQATVIMESQTSS